MTEKKLIGGVDVIPSHLLPNSTMYVSMNIYEAMLKDQKIKKRHANRNG